MSSRIHILGIPIDAVTQQEAIRRMHAMLVENRLSHVVTPNSEMLVDSFRIDRFRSVLLQSSLNLPDSAGLLFAAWWTGQHLPEHVTGVDTVERFCLQLTEEHPVFFLGGRHRVAARTAEVLHKHNPHLCIAGVYEGTPKPQDATAIIHRINDSSAHILLVAYGAPQQDLWIAAHASEFTTVRLAIGVGGTFDFLAGAVRRAPRWVQSLYLEWLWRLLLQPRRVFRILKAVFGFVTLVVLFGREGNA